MAPRPSLRIFALRRPESAGGALLELQAGRFPMVHVKDRNSAGEMTDVGRGEIDFAEIFSHSETAGIKHYFVEHDFPEDGLDSVAFSINSLNNIYF